MTYSNQNESAFTSPAGFGSEITEQNYHTDVEAAMPTGRLNDNNTPSPSDDSHIEMADCCGTNSPTEAETPAILRFICEQNQNGGVIDTSSLVLHENSPKNRFDQNKLAEIYEELNNKKCVKLNPNKLSRSTLTKWNVTDGLGVISFNGRIRGFTYGSPASIPLRFKARLGYSEKFEDEICVIKFEDRFYVPDYLLFRGSVDSDGSVTQDAINIAYLAAGNHFDVNHTSEYPNSMVGDTLFTTLMLALMGGLTKESKVILDAELKTLGKLR